VSEPKVNIGLHLKAKKTKKKKQQNHRQLQSSKYADR